MTAAATATGGFCSVTDEMIFTALNERGARIVPAGLKVEIRSLSTEAKQRLHVAIISPSTPTPSSAKVLCDMIATAKGDSSTPRPVSIAFSPLSVPTPCSGVSCPSQATPSVPHHDTALTALVEQINEFQPGYSPNGCLSIDYEPDYLIPTLALLQPQERTRLVDILKVNFWLVRRGAAPTAQAQAILSTLNRAEPETDVATELSAILQQA